MCACVCVYVYVYISRVILAHHSLFVTVDTPDRIRSRENVINWPCRDIAKFIRRNLSVCRFLVVDLLPYRFRNILSYLSVEIEIDLESNWYRRSRTAQLGFEQRLLNNLCNNVPNVSIPPRDSRNFTIFLPPLENQKLRSQLFLHRDYCYVIINFYSFTRFTCAFTTSTKNHGETSRR